MKTTSHSVRFTIFIIMISIFGLFLQCDSTATRSQDDQQIPFLSSALGRDTSPNVSELDLDQIADDNTEFAIDLYLKLGTGPQNIVYSPYSLSLAMAMAYGGAGSDTSAQIAETFNFFLPFDDFHPAFNALDLALRQREYADSGKILKLKIANDFWGQINYEFKNSYLDLLALNYGSGIYLLDFMNNPDACTARINRYIEDYTQGLIKDIIPPGAIDDATRAVLTNAIYFYANWINEFSRSATVQAPFYLLDGSETTVPMMNQTELFSYSESEDVDAVELPYAGNKIAMLIVMPKEGTYDAFQENLTAEKLNTIIAGLEWKNIALSMPKFSVEYTIDGLPNILSSMGMSDAFNPYAADFFGITELTQLYIGNILHKAVIKVDEEGTEAAAATVIIFVSTSIPEPPVSVTINRPFIFFVRDKETGTLLFMGRVLNPGDGS